MPDLYFDDFIPGADLPQASLVVEPQDAAFFAETFAPGAAGAGEASASPAVLSGWHVAALGMRLLFEAVLVRTAGLGAPGIDEVTWPHPVRPGDRLRFAGRVTAARGSASRPEMGLVTVAFSLFNARDIAVMTQTNVIMVARRMPAERSGTEART